jgi:hypothetical protein
MTTRPSITSRIGLVFAAQLIVAFAATASEDTSWSWVGGVGLLLCIIGAPVAYFMVLRRAFFRASSPGVQLAAAVVSGVLLGTFGLGLVAVITLICFPR